MSSEVIVNIGPYWTVIHRPGPLQRSVDWLLGKVRERIR